MAAKEQGGIKTFFILDGTAMAYRAYFAFIRNPLINSKGMNTSGAFGFVNSLMKILRDEQPDYIACVFDTSAPTFRHEKYAEYKATREKMPDDLREQLPAIRQLVEAFQIPRFEMAGFEADDLMGTLAKLAESKGLITYMVSGDKDMMQIVSDRIRMYSSGSRGSPEVNIVDPSAVREKMGVPPEKIVDLLALMGDSSDNVPGVPGVGPKTALALLEEYGTMEEVLDHAADVKRPKIRENLETFRDQAVLSKELVTLDVNAPIDVQLEDLRVQAIDRDAVVQLFQELEFKRLIEDIPGGSVTPKQELKRDYTIIQSIEDLDEFVLTLEKIPMFAVDLETTSLDPLSADIVGISFSWKEGEATYIPVMCPEDDAPRDLFSQPEGTVLPTILEKLQPILEDPKVRKCGQNIKYDMRVFLHHGVRLQGVDFDTMVAAYLINPSTRQFGIDALALEYLNIKKIPTKEIIGTGRKQITMDLVDLEKVAEYASEDADVTFQLRTLLEPKLKESDMESLFSDVEMPLVHVLLEMEENGVALDQPFLEEMSTNMEKQLLDIQKNIYEMAGEEFNINSTQQLGKILFEKLKVHELVGGRRPRRTKTGYSTDVRVLESLASHPLPKTLLDFRQLTKLKSTYVDALPKLIHPKTGRVHASFNQTVAATGRLSTSDPNLQNIPIRTELGREIRKAFIAEGKDSVLISADYSQIELRLMAHISGDETLLDSFRKDEDVHRRTAAEMFGIPEPDVTDDHRRQAKTINFGIMYGMGEYGLANRLEIPVDEARAFIEAYFERYPKVNAYMANTIAQANELGYVTTLLHRRRYLPELKSDNRNVHDFGERTAINTPIQGTAADLIKVAMIRVAERLRQEKWQSKMILQIHDELLFEAPENEAAKLSALVKKEMEQAIELSVPIKVEVGMGENWFEAH